MTGKVPVPLILLLLDKKFLHPSTSMSIFDRLLPSDTKKYQYSSRETKICKNIFTPLLVCVDFYNKPPKNIELSGTFFDLGGTELKWNGASYNFAPLERNFY